MKILWETEKMLVTSIFSFSHSFLPFPYQISIPFTIILSPANAFNLDQSKTLLCGKEFRKIFRRGVCVLLKVWIVWERFTLWTIMFQRNFGWRLFVNIVGKEENESKKIFLHCPLCFWKPCLNYLWFVTFNDPDKEGLWKHCWKRRKCW